MPRITQRLTPAMLALSIIVDAQDYSRVLEAQAKRQVGRTATLCGTVVAYQCPRPARTSLLALEKPFDKSRVTVAIAAEDRVKFGTLFEQRHVLLNVCATGPIEKQKNRYVLSVTDPAQLQLRGPSSAVNFAPDAVSACDEGVELPKVIKDVKPAYTSAAMRAGIQGIAHLEAVVLTDGHVGDIRLLRSLDARLGLDDQAIKAFRSWVFSPGTVKGRAVPVVVTVDMSFSLGR